MTPGATGAPPSAVPSDPREIQTLEIFQERLVSPGLVASSGAGAPCPTSAGPTLTLILVVIDSLVKADAFGDGPGGAASGFGNG